MTRLLFNFGYISFYYYYSVLIYFVNIFSVNWLAIFNRQR